jgi:hypothetical protein
MKPMSRRSALMPGNQADVLVTMAPGTSVLQTHPVDRASPACMMGVVCVS